MATGFMGLANSLYLRRVSGEDSAEYLIFLLGRSITGARGLLLLGARQAVAGQWIVARVGLVGWRGGRLTTFVAG